MQRNSRTAKNGRSENSKVDTGDAPTYWLKPEQIDDLRDATLENSAHYLAERDDSILAMLADTGLRVAECASLDESMIDFDDGVLRIPARIQKGDAQPETIGLASDTLRTLRKYINSSWYQGKETDALFPGRSSDRISTQGIRNVVSSAAEDGDIRPNSPEGAGTPDDVTPHTLRHSVCYRMLSREDGNTLYDVTKRLRHSSISTTEAYYSHFDVV